MPSFHVQGAPGVGLRWVGCVLAGTRDMVPRWRRPSRRGRGPPRREGGGFRIDGWGYNAGCGGPITSVCTLLGSRGRCLGALTLSHGQTCSTAPETGFLWFNILVISLVTSILHIIRLGNLGVFVNCCRVFTASL